MGKLLSYLIISGLIMLAMCLVYKLFIARENQHRFNRALLLMIYGVSFSAYPIYNCIANLTVNAGQATTIDVDVIKTISIEATTAPLWGTVLIWIFIIGAVVVAVKSILTWIKIVGVIRSGTEVKSEGCTLVVIDNDKIAPFSWMRYVVVNRTDFDNYNSAIISHELKHVSSLHWIDLLIAQFVCIINWFNPAAWLMRDELMLVHEYQADMAVIENGHNAQEYQMLLIKKAVGARFPSLANSINHSKLKKRITMMSKSKSGAGSKMKALALVPMVALALGVTAMPAVKAAVSTISSSGVSLDKGNENLPKSAQFKIASLNNSGVETTVVVLGEGLGEYLSVSDVSFTNKGNRFSANSLKTNMTDGRATITAVFPFADNYENASVTFIVNGQEVNLNLDDFRKNSQTSSISISPSNGILISQGNATLSTVGDMEIYLDGKKISADEMKSLNPNDIESVIVNKEQKVIVILTHDAENANTTDKKTDSAQSRIKKDGNKEIKVTGVGTMSREEIVNKTNIYPQSSISEDMDIYLDGNKISEAKMKALNPETIASMTIDKQNNAIRITSK